MVTTAIAERQSFVTRSAFGGNLNLVAERIAAIEAVQATTDNNALTAWARAVPLALATGYASPP